MSLRDEVREIPNVDIWSWVLLKPEGQHHLSNDRFPSRTLCGIRHGRIDYINQEPASRNRACGTCLRTYYGPNTDGPNLYPGNIVQ